MTPSQHAARACVPCLFPAFRGVLQYSVSLGFAVVRLQGCLRFLRRLNKAGKICACRTCAGDQCLSVVNPAMLPTHVVLILLGVGFHSAKAVSFDVQESLCNVPCGQKGMWSMDQKGATAKVGTCYHCFQTSYGNNCPSGTDHVDDGWTYDDCCEGYTCSCRSGAGQRCTQNQVGDGTCQPNCNTASCGFDSGDCSSGSAAPSPPPPQHCPCCSKPSPKYPETGARAENGVCWHCYQTDYGGDCPDADQRSDGWT